MTMSESPECHDNDGNAQPLPERKLWLPAILKVDSELPRVLRTIDHGVRT